MGSLNIRNLAGETHKALRIQTARHGRPMEAEVRAILDEALNPANTPGLGAMLAAIGREFGGVELTVVRDTTPAEPAVFERSSSTPTCWRNPCVPTAIRPSRRGSTGSGGTRHI